MKKSGIQTHQDHCMGFAAGGGIECHQKYAGGGGVFEGSAKDRREDAKMAKQHGMNANEWERSPMDRKMDKKGK